MLFSCDANDKNRPNRFARLPVSDGYPAEFFAHDANRALFFQMQTKVCFSPHEKKDLPPP